MSKVDETRPSPNPNISNIVISNHFDFPSDNLHMWFKMSNILLKLSRQIFFSKVIYFSLPIMNEIGLGLTSFS